MIRSKNPALFSVYQKELERLHEEVSIHRKDVHLEKNTPINFKLVQNKKEGLRSFPLDLISSTKDQVEKKFTQLKKCLASSKSDLEYELYFEETEEFLEEVTKKTKHDAPFDLKQIKKYEELKKIQDSIKRVAYDSKTIPRDEVAKKQREITKQILGSNDESEYLILVEEIEELIEEVNSEQKFDLLAPEILGFSEMKETAKLVRKIEYVLKDLDEKSSKTTLSKMQRSLATSSNELVYQIQVMQLEQFVKDCASRPELNIKSLPSIHTFAEVQIIKKSAVKTPTDVKLMDKSSTEELLKKLSKKVETSSFNRILYDLYAEEVEETLNAAKTTHPGIKFPELEHLVKSFDDVQKIMAKLAKKISYDCSKLSTKEEFISKQSEFVTKCYVSEAEVFYDS